MTTATRPSRPLLGIALLVSSMLAAVTSLGWGLLAWRVHSLETENQRVAASCTCCGVPAVAVPVGGD